MLFRSTTEGKREVSNHPNYIGDLMGASGFEDLQTQLNERIEILAPSMIQQRCHHSPHLSQKEIQKQVRKKK